MNINLKSTLPSIILILLLGDNIAFGQQRFPPNDPFQNKTELPQKIKRITQNENDEIISIKEFDLDRNLIFHYHKQMVGDFWRGKYITMIEVYEYSNGRLLKAYHLHSNAGFTIWYYQYDSLGNNIKVFQQENDYDDQDSLINKNQYEYISKILTLNDLINHPKIKELESKSNRYLLWERSYDTLGNLCQEITYSSNGDTSLIERYNFDQNNNQVYSNYQLSDEISWEYFYEYEMEISINEDNEPLPKQPAKLIQSVRLDYNKLNQNKRVSEIQFYKYDEKNRLIEYLEFREGLFNGKTIFQYDGNERVNKKTHYIRNETEIAINQFYEYNKEGNIIKESLNDFRTGEKKSTEFQYKYEYY